MSDSNRRSFLKKAPAVAVAAAVAVVTVAAVAATGTKPIAFDLECQQEGHALRA